MARKQERETGKQALDEELREARLQLRRAYDAFDLVTDPDLIDAWIYEINAWQARYCGLLRQRKAMEPEAAQGDEVRT